MAKGTDNKLQDLVEKIKSGKRLYIDYDKERKVVGRKQKVKDRGVYYYAQDNDFSKNNNEIPKDYENKIICGDSEDILKKLPDNCIDLVFTSPPYNFGLDYENHTKNDIHNKRTL